MIDPFGVVLVTAFTASNEAGFVRPIRAFLVLTGRLIQECLLQLLGIAAGVVDVMAGVDASVVPFDFGIDVIAAAGGIKPALVEPIAGLLVLIEVDGDDGVISAGGLGFAVPSLSPADQSPGLEVSVQVFLIMRQLVFEDIHVGMLDVTGLIVALAVTGIVLVVSRVHVGGHVGPIGEFAVDFDFAHGVGKGRLGKHGD